jgi:hypothetical protein
MATACRGCCHARSAEKNKCFVLPRGWVCVPRCVCWTLGSMGPGLTRCFWAAQLRPAVHAHCEENTTDTWAALQQRVVTLHECGMTARSIAYVLSEMHHVLRSDKWASCLWHSEPSQQSRTRWLLDWGCCPNIASAQQDDWRTKLDCFSFQQYCEWYSKSGSRDHAPVPENARVWTPSTSPHLKLLQLSGGFPGCSSLCLPLPLQWQRYHGRLQRVMWLKRALPTA